MADMGPFPQALRCCCWICPQVPVSVGIVGGVAPCCDVPSGTHTFGSGTPGLITGNNTRFWNRATKTLGTGPANVCQWTWEYDRNLVTACPINNIVSVAICKTDDLYTPVHGGTVVGSIYVAMSCHVHMLKCYNKLTVVVWRTYAVRACNTTDSLTTGEGGGDTYDIYEADVTDCDDLPVIMYLTERKEQWFDRTNVLTPNDDTIIYGWDNVAGTYTKYSYTMCAAAASVTINYV